MELQLDVPASYPSECKLVFVGDVPGKEHEEKCLQRAANMAQLNWLACGKSNVAKRQVSRGKFRETFYETIEEPVYTPTGKLSKRTKKVTQPTAELRAWKDLLYEELRTQRPNLIVALGNGALEALTEFTSIANYRGSILSAKYDASVKVLAVEHPRDILWGNMLGFWILSHDLKKAKREMEFPEIQREPFASWHDPEHSLAHILYELGELKRFPTMKWSLDVETRAGTLACFSIAYRNLHNPEWRTFCIPLQTTTGPYWSPVEEMELWNALRTTALANPNLCNQNIEYDIYYLLRYGVEPSGVWMDTMLAHSILYPEFPKGLDFLCSFYLDDIVYYKGEGRNWNAGDRDPQLWEYCCKDAVYTLRVVEKIDEELKRRGLFDAYHGTN